LYDKQPWLAMMSWPILCRY